MLEEERLIKSTHRKSGCVRSRRLDSQGEYKKVRKTLDFVMKLVEDVGKEPFNNDPVMKQSHVHNKILLF
jgi:hypothetical protein